MIFDEMITLSEVVKQLSELIGAGKEIETDDYSISAKNEDGTIKIQVNSKFNDSYVKEAAASYKEAIKKLDDDTFVEVVEEMKQQHDINHFNELLELESFTEDQAEEVLSMITKFNSLTRSKLQHKIQVMVELYEQF